MDENQLFNLLSLGKSLTAAVIIKLAQEGKLELHDVVEKYLPERNIPNQNKITIRQLLSHSSGLGDYMTAEDYKNRPRSKVNLDTLLSLVENQSVNKNPSESVVYSNSGYIILGAIIEAIEKKPYKKVLMEKILEPAAIEEVYFSGDNREVKYYVEDSEEPVNRDFPPAFSDGGVWMNAKDMSKFLSFLFSDELTEESRNLLFQRIINFPNRGEVKNAGLGASFIVYEYPKGVKVIENNGGYKGSTYSAFRIMYNEKGEKIIATVLSNQKDTAGSAMEVLEAEIKKFLQ